MEFKKVKQLILDKAKELNACSDQFNRAKESKNKRQLLRVVKDNFSFCYPELIDAERLESYFGLEMCAKEGMYFKGEVDEIKDQGELLFFGDLKCKMLDNSTVTEMWDNSTVTEMWGNSTVTKMWGNSTVTEMFDNSTVTEMFDNSTVTEMFDNSTVTTMSGNSTVTKMFDNSTVTEMLGNSTVTEMWDNSTVTEMWGNSTVTEMFDNSTVKIPSSIFSTNIENIKSQSGKSQIIDLKNNKIHIVNSKFEIVEH